jgi:hypothetical protein
VSRKTLGWIAAGLQAHVVFTAWAIGEQPLWVYIALPVQIIAIAAFAAAVSDRALSWRPNASDR